MAAVANKPEPSRMTFGAVKRGVIHDNPKRVLLYGPEGIGKSTFAAGAPAAISICPEDGTAQLDIDRFPEPHSWDDVMEAVRACTHDDHDRRTLVIDTLDWIEPFVWRHICTRDGKASVEDYGYGKGYTAALDEWRRLLTALDGLRKRRSMSVILLAHAHVKAYKNPEGEDYDRFGLKLNEKAGGLFKEWADAVLFANYETFVKTKENKTKAFGGGARIVHTERRAAWDAKNRYGLPETLPLSWVDFADACDGERLRVAAVKAEIVALLGASPDPKVAKWVTETDDLGKLAEACNRLKAKAAVAAENKTEVAS